MKKTSTCLPLFALALIPVLAALPAGASSTHWPQFRGAGVDGVAQAPGAISDLGRVGLSVTWKRELGSGYSGISVADGWAVTMFTDGETDYLVGLDAESGEELWREPLGEMYPGHDGSHDGPIATPLIHDGRVITLSAQGQLVAVDLETGERLWATSLPEDHGAAVPFYGFGNSPSAASGLVVVGMGGEGKAVGGFDPASGELAWSAGFAKYDYQAPVPVELFGRDQLVTADASHLYGLDPTSGEVLWTHEHEGRGARGMMSMVPIRTGENRFFLAYRDDGSKLVELSEGEDGVEMATVWEGRAIRNSYNIPVYHNGHIYAFSSRFLTCVDAETGEAVWRSRRPGDGFLMLVDDHLVILTKNGSVHVADATPDGYREIAQVELFEELAWTPPSFSDGRIYVRSLSEIARLDLTETTAIVDSGIEVDSDLAGTKFGSFLERVRAADDKQVAVDEFLAAQESFPIVEGDDLVHFVYSGPAEDLAIAGDLIGTRQEAPMERVEGTNLFYYSARLEPDARLNYLFIKDYEETVDPRNPRQTSTTQVGKDMEFSRGGGELPMSWMAMPKWVAPAHLAEAPAEAPRGRIESHTLGEEPEEGAEDAPPRPSIDVYVPAGYDASEAAYDTVYVHGGAAALERGEWARSLDNLIASEVEPVLVVFVNLPMGGFGFGPYAEAFATQVVPFVDANYRTVAGPEGRASVGAGFMGYIAFFSAWSTPGLVGKVGSQSLMMLTRMQGALEGQAKSAEELPLDIYLDWGRYDMRNPHEAWSNVETNREFVEYLKAKGYAPVGGEVADGSGWSSWRNRTDSLLKALYPLGGAE